MRFVLERTSEVEFVINSDSGASSLGGIAADVIDSLEMLTANDAAEQVVFYATEDSWAGTELYKVVVYDDDGSLLIEEVVNIG